MVAVLVIVMVVVTLPPMGTVGVAFEKVQVALAGRPVHAIATLPEKLPDPVRVMGKEGRSAGLNVLGGCGGGHGEGGSRLDG